MSFRQPRRKKVGNSYLASEPTESHVQTMQQGSSNFLVAVRCRPLNKKQRIVDSHQAIHVISKKVAIIINPKTSHLHTDNRQQQKQYAFDYVFDRSTKQIQIFQTTTEFLLQGVIKGFNATVFAYGATGAGKTFTMIGQQNNPGIMPLTFKSLFKLIGQASNQNKYNVKMSYLEIYNQIVRDLLNPSVPYLDLRQDPLKGVQVAGLKEIMATSLNDITSLIRKGNKERICEPTQVNQTSSRSHAVLQVTVEHKDPAQNEIMVGKLSLVDLAGSQRASRTNNRGIRMIQGANINRSLLALANCINALCEASQKSKVFVPYRDSKLTRLLKDSLGGNCRTVMIACVSPATVAYEDSNNTLKYANRAKQIKTNIQRNVLSAEYHISKYQELIQQLREEVVSLRKELGNKQTSGKFDLEKKELQINSHFQQEANVRKQLHQAQSAIQEFGFAFYAKQRQIDQGKVKPNSNKWKALKEECTKLKASIEEFKDAETEYQKIYTQLQKKREEMKKKISSDRSLPKAIQAQLQVKLQDHIIAMNGLELNQQKHQDEVINLQKDNYIKLLEEQLRIRDLMLNHQKQTLVQNNLKPIQQPPEALKFKSLQEISLNSIRKMQKPQNFNPKTSKITGTLPHMIPKKLDYRDNMTPNSRIPRISNSSQNSSNQEQVSSVQKKAKFLKYTNNQLRSSSSKLQLSNHLKTNHQLKVAQKIKASPYLIQRGSDNPQSRRNLYKF